MVLAFFCRDKDNKSSPVQQFLSSRYGDDLDLHPAEINKVFRAWSFALNREGVCGGGNYLKKLSGFDAIEIRVKNGAILIRFPFFLDKTNKRIVLLLGYAKPENYPPRGKDAREVERKQIEAQEYYDEYLNNNDKYYISEEINETLRELYGYETY